MSKEKQLIEAVLRANPCTRFYPDSNKQSKTISLAIDTLAQSLSEGYI